MEWNLVGIPIDCWAAFLKVQYTVATHTHTHTHTHAVVGDT